MMLIGSVSTEGAFDLFAIRIVEDCVADTLLVRPSLNREFVLVVVKVAGSQSSHLKVPFV